MAMPGRGTRSLDLRRHNLAGFDRRRSSELSRRCGAPPLLGEPTHPESGRPARAAARAACTRVCGPRRFLWQLPGPRRTLTPRPAATSGRPQLCAAPAAASLQHAALRRALGRGGEDGHAPQVRRRHHPPRAFAGAVGEARRSRGGAARSAACRPGTPPHTTPPPAPPPAGHLLLVARAARHGGAVSAAAAARVVGGTRVPAARGGGRRRVGGSTGPHVPCAAADAARLGEPAAATCTALRAGCLRSPGDRPPCARIAPTRLPACIALARCVRQPLLEGLLLLADKYDMGVLLERAAAELLAPSRHFSMEPAAPNFALR